MPVSFPKVVICHLPLLYYSRSLRKSIISLIVLAMGRVNNIGILLRSTNAWNVVEVDCQVD